MRLTQLEPEWLKRVAPDQFQCVETIGQADGLWFLCPKCWTDRGGTNVGVHSIICWRPNVPQDTSPTGGRWEMHGSGFDDLSLTASSNSVAVTGGCAAHFFIESGAIRMC